MSHWWLCFFSKKAIYLAFLLLVKALVALLSFYESNQELEVYDSDLSPKLIRSRTPSGMP